MKSSVVMCDMCPWWGISRVLAASQRLPTILPRTSYLSGSKGLHLAGARPSQDQVLVQVSLTSFANTRSPSWQLLWVIHCQVSIQVSNCRRCKDGQASAAVLNPPGMFHKKLETRFCNTSACCLHALWCFQKKVVFFCEIFVSLHICDSSLCHSVASQHWTMEWHETLAPSIIAIDSDFWTDIK